MAGTMKPSFTVWTRKLEDENSWIEELSTDDVEQALELAFELGADDTISTVYERGRFTAGGRRRTGSILFWWSANFNDVMGEPIARGQGWPEGYDEHVTYEPIGAAALASRNSPQVTAAVSPPRRYRTIYCDTCGVEIPKIEANEYTRSVEVGRSSGSTRTYSSSTSRFSKRSFSSSSTFGRSSSSGRTYYKRQTVLLCDDCYRQRTESDAAEFRLKVILGVIAVIAFMVYKGLYGS